MIMEIFLHVFEKKASQGPSKRRPILASIPLRFWLPLHAPRAPKRVPKSPPNEQKKRAKMHARNRLCLFMFFAPFFVQKWSLRTNKSDVCMLVFIWYSENALFSIAVAFRSAFRPTLAPFWCPKASKNQCLKNVCFWAPLGKM